MIPLLTAACIHTPTPSTPTSAAFEWTVTLADGDGLDDGAVGIDADTLTVAIRNSRTNFPSIVEWSYGYAMTRLGPDLGWYGEDCDGLVTQNHDICHEMDPDSTLVLTRPALES